MAWNKPREIRFILKGEKINWQIGTADLRVTFTVSEEKREAFEGELAKYLKFCEDIHGSWKPIVALDGETNEPSMLTIEFSGRQRMLYAGLEHHAEEFINKSDWQE